MFPAHKKFGYEEEIILSGEGNNKNVWLLQAHAYKDQFPF